MAKKKTDEPVDPDKLIREVAGAYRTTDGRFEARQAGAGWFLVDLERTNELGQELLHGPFATLKEARAGIDDARKVVPLARPRRVAAAKAAPPPPPPKTWIDRLPDDEQADVRRLIGAVEKAGFDDAEELVKKSRGSSQPVLAAALVERLLNELIEDAEPAQRRSRRDLVRRVLAILTDEGALTSPPLPRWELVERSPDQELGRRLRPSV